jgi:hypothetical protein
VKRKTGTKWAQNPRKSEREMHSMIEDIKQTFTVPVEVHPNVLRWGGKKAKVTVQTEPGEAGMKL